MDDTWQVKCGSAWQSSVPSAASSASQELRSQVDLSSGQRFLYSSHVGKELRSQVQAKSSTDSMTTNISGFSSYTMGHGEVGNSFQALLSGPASLLHGDFQEFSNPKLFNPLYKRPSEFGGSFASKTVETRIPNTSHQRVQNGLNFCVSKALIGSGSGLQHGFPAASINLQRSGMAMADILPLVSGNESIKDYTFPQGECCNTISMSSVNLQKINMPLPQKMSLEAEVTKHSSPLSGCPRVFCMGISGDLLLSNTGLLGILCSCHCFHMSVLKFCEHSGLKNVNAGDAVRMDSGESIAQWRKLYFQKFGIRVPEDQNGWDWPEGLSLTASLVKSGASLPMSASNKSKKPDLNHDIEPSVVSERLRQPPYDNFLLKKPVANQNSDELHNRQERNGQDSDKFLIRGLLGTFQSNFCGARNNKLVRSPSPRCPTMPEFDVQGPKIGSQSLSANVHGIVKTGTVPTFHPTLQNLGISVKSSAVNRPVKAKDGFDKDPVSSNIELRLGQPYHQSMSAGNPVLSSMGPWVHSRLVDSKMPFSAEQTHKVTMSKQEEARQNLPQFVGLFDCTARSKEHLEQHLHYRKCPINPTMDSSNQETADMSKNPVVSLYKQFNTSPDGCTPPNVTNINQQVLPETIYCESPIVRGNSIDISQNASNFLERHPGLSFINSIDKGKPVGCNAGSNCSETVSLSKLHNCWENPSSFTGFVSQNGHSEFPSIHNNGWLHFSSVKDVSDAGKISHCNEKVSCVGSSGLGNHVMLKSMVSAIASPQILSPQPVRTGLLSPCTELTPALFKQESICSSPYLLDDNLRLIALKQILELSKQQQVISHFGKNLEQWKCSNSSDASLIHTVAEPSKSGEQRLDSKVTHREALCEFSARSIQAYPFGSNTIQDYPFSSNTSNDLHPGPSVSGIDNRCNPSQSGTPCNYKENVLQHQLPCDPLTVKQPSLTLSRNGKGIASANKHGNCCHRTFYIQGTCGCRAHTKCLGDKCNLRKENSPNLFGEPIGSICGEASSLISSQLVKDCTVLKETAASSDQCRKPNSDIGKSISCHASKWKDVPSKVKSICDTNKSTVVLGGRKDELAQLGDTEAKCSNGTMKVEDFLREKEISNVSFGRSAPAVTQASVVSKNIEFSPAHVVNTVCVNNNIVDEGSGIDKCWSSDDALESDPSADFYGSTCKTSLRTERSFEGSNNQPSRTLLDEVKLMNSLTWRKGQHQIRNSTAGDGKTGLSEESEMGMKTGKRKRETILRILDASLSNEGPLSCDNAAERPCLSKDEPSSKRGKSKSSSVKPLPRKRDLLRLYHETDREDDRKNETNDASAPNQTLGISSSKKFRSTVISDGCRKFQKQKKVKTIGEDAVNFNLMGCTKTDCHQVNLHCRKARPIVCGKYGEITNGKPAKIVSLDKVLKNAKRCILRKKSKPRLSIWREGRRTNFRWSDAYFDKFSKVKKTKENRDNDASGSDDMNLHTSAKERTKASSSEDKLFGDESLLLENQMDFIVEKDNTHAQSQSKPKIKEIRKRSLHELRLKGKNSDLRCDKKNLKNIAEREFKKPFKSDEDVGESWKNNAKRCDQDKKHQSIEDSFPFCCVCGSSNEDEINCLLECGRCLIKIHQACYGVCKVPKGLWYCRPCRTSSTDIACVLCGYGGGAMTRALRSQTIVKGLLKAWSLEEESWPKNASSCTETLHDKLNMVHSSGSGLKNNAYSVANSVVDPSTAAVWNVNMENQMDTMLISLSSISNLKVHNSITTGVHDSSVKQWVHMVCGLWTPGTRCPNVDTMSAFDVSGASCPQASVICSICNRPGGTCIQCRVVNCSVQFHPWCAHQKGLLQSEVEGIDNENVGFYGQCILHTTYPTNDSSDNAACTGKECLGRRKESCARTEGYKGRKLDGFWHNPNQLKGKQCLVPQEQLNAWIHINGQKSCIQGLPKLPVSDMEYDCRKEYNRYKQAKGWKRLVVYKSGIHALGLYTSQFIFRGEMVVEYVGEIVGLRVADKRENEYQSGRKLQYKSACYFFRIDTEHIIDATRKGGIARFVNHSCLPNCAAKVISVRNEKKVVFFAERDIYPGEEITYDYHFNHEDEGKKIPCFCNSKNCRRYLN